MAIDKCPECDAPLHARREVWFTSVSLGGDGSILSATQRGDMDEVWRVYCTRGHEIVPTLVVGSRQPVEKGSEGPGTVVHFERPEGGGVSTAPVAVPAEPAPPPAVETPSMPLAEMPSMPVAEPEPEHGEPEPEPPAGGEAGTAATAALPAAHAHAEPAGDASLGDFEEHEEPSRTRGQVVALVLGWLLFLLGAAAITAAVVYFTVTANDLPSWMGQVVGSTAHRRKPGALAGAVGVVLWAAAAFAFVRARAAVGPDDLVVGT